MNSLNLGFYLTTSLFIVKEKLKRSNKLKHWSYKLHNEDDSMQYQ